MEYCLLSAEEYEFPQWNLNLEYNDKMKHAADLSDLRSFPSVILWGRDELTEQACTPDLVRLSASASASRWSCSSVSLPTVSL